jgi:diadenosine tetraphosphate (Ap4A) HIT family hydrolase
MSRNEPYCPFCNPYGEEVVAQNTLCYARWDAFPVTRGHLLIIPFRHTPDYFSLSSEEKQAITDLIDECRGVIEDNFQPAGYNIGYNIGTVAGQTIMHCHCHLIPRYAGDTDNPKGGVRRVVAGKYYKDPRRRIIPVHPATRQKLGPGHRDE